MTTEYQPWRPTINRSDSESPQPTVPCSLLPGGEYALSQISATGFLVGVTAGLAIGISTYCFAIGSAYFQPALFLLSLCVFHFMEFYTTARYNTARADVDAYLLTNNGPQYTTAHTAAFLESLIETYFFPSLKSHPRYITIGLILLILGQTARSVAMCTAGSNFTHLVARRKLRGHQLVTHGIYGFLRHPSYTGYFWWAVGSQIMLGNPFCTVGFAIVLVYFFGTRIKREEQLLITFFGDEYVRYRQRTWVLIPGIFLFA